MSDNLDKERPWFDSEDMYKELTEEEEQAMMEYVTSLFIESKDLLFSHMKKYGYRDGLTSVGFSRSKKDGE